MCRIADSARQAEVDRIPFKFFTVDDEQQRAVNFYAWGSEDAARSFFTEQMRERVTGLYGVAPANDFVEIAQIVDNSGS